MTGKPTGPDPTSTGCPHILFHRPTPWSSDVECSTKVLSRLSAELGCIVTYLQAPLDPVHLVKGRGYLADWRTLPKTEDGVRIVGSFTPVPVRDMWPLSTRSASYLRYAWSLGLKREVTANNRGAPDLIWTTVPGSARALKRIFPEARCVFHVIDYYPAFRGRAVVNLERDDYAVADNVFVIGQALADYLIKDLFVDPAKITVLGQGVDTRRFAHASQEPEDIAELPHPRGVWVGVLSKGDPDLFEATARQFSSVAGSLILIGPSAPWAERLAERWPGVVKLLGSKDPASIPAYLTHSEVGLMLYAKAKSAVYRGQNPLKLYEYAAAGVSIVSTDHAEFRTLKPPAAIVSDPRETERAIAAILKKDRTERSSVARSFAEEHDWNSKIREVLIRFFPEHPPKMS